MKKISWWKKWAGAACWLVYCGAATAAESELRFGVFPSLSPRVLVETYQPLTIAVGESIREPVNLETAPDFMAFHQRTLNGDYDLVLTAPHLAWLAWKEGGYRPLLTYVTPVKGIVIVRADSAIQRISDLRGKTLAMPDPLAIVGIRMEQILEKKAGLRKNRDFKVAVTGSHTNAAAYVKEGQADAAVVGIQAFHQLPEEMKRGMRTIAETSPMPGQVFLANGRLSEARAQAVARSIEAFTRSEAGKVFIEKGKFGGVRHLKKNEMKEMEAEARILKLRLHAQSPAGDKAR